MIIFNNLKISQDNKCLYIDVQIDNSIYFKDMYIDSIFIDTDETYVSNGPSNNAIKVYTASSVYPEIFTEDDLDNNVLDEEDQAIIYDDEEDYSYARQVSLSLDKTILGSLENRIFFVYVIAGGNPSPNTPCGMDVTQVMKAVINTYPIYQNSMNYIKELDSLCKVPQNFIDYILNVEAFDLSIQTGNYNKAIQLWKDYFCSLPKIETLTCGCNERT